MTRKDEFIGEHSEEFNVIPAVNVELQQIDFIKYIVQLLNIAIQKNFSLQKPYRLDISQGPTFIRVNVMRKFNSMLHKNILIISFKRDSTLSRNGIYEYRNDVYSIGIDGRLSNNIPVNNTKEINDYVITEVIPFIEGYKV